LQDLVIATEKNDPPVISELQLDETVARSIKQLKSKLAQKDITVFNQIPTGLPALEAEPDKFQRLFDVLLKDEMIRLPAGSQIFISARLASGKKQEIEIDVWDDGPPWPDEALRSAFDPFSLRINNPQEFAINLLAGYFIVHQHGGSIEVRNRGGRGVIFRVTFPLRFKASSPTEREEGFVSTVILNDAFWELILAGQN
jgi:K+-sensing histidine kinase KdpD